MTPEALAALHAASFTMPRPWSAIEFAGLLADRHVFLLTESGGFLLARVVADEAELLTLAVAPTMRRQGLGRRLVAQFLMQAKLQGATRAFLEVSTENVLATRLYAISGFVETGRRKGYFHGPDGRPADALVLCCNL